MPQKLTFLCLAQLIWSFTPVRSEGVFVKVYPEGAAEDGDWTEVSTIAVNLNLRCELLAGPTEWVYDYDLTNITAPKFPCGRAEWNHRWHPLAGHLNRSFVQLRCDSFGSDLVLYCRAVTNHSDNVMVKLETNLTTNTLQISKQRGACLNEEPPDQNSSNCVQFSVAEMGKQKFWRCDGPEGGQGHRRGKIGFWYCGSSSDCANTQRKLKLVPVCVQHLDLDGLTNQTITAEQGWRSMSSAQVAKYPAGVAVCELDDRDGEYLGAAVEFFFAGKDKSTQ